MLPGDESQIFPCMRERDVLAVAFSKKEVYSTASLLQD